jgi:CheY-like chemotaxis protein
VAADEQRVRQVASLVRPAATTVVLHVEDNLANLRLVEEVFVRRPEVRLVTAQQGSLGLELAAEHRPDLILLDLHLPDLDGDEVLQRLKASDATAGIPVVVVSADATERQVQRLRALGAHDYLTKPLDVAHLLDVVDGLLAVAAAEGGGSGP